MPIRLVPLVCMLALASTARAEVARFYNLEGFGEFLDGNPESTAVTEDGAIVLPPVTREQYADAAATFSAATTRGDAVVVARVDDGEVIAIDRAGKAQTLFEAEESLVTALLSTKRGLFVATAEPAKIYRVDAKGSSKVFHTPDASYIWGMVEGPGGSILAVTGGPGTVIKIDSEGNGSILFEPEQEHLRSIAYDGNLGIFVGGGERGVLYRSTRGKAFKALYDTGHPEITSIVIRDAAVYVAGVTGADALVTAQSNGKDSAKKSTVEVRSQVVQVSMDGASETLAGSNDEAVFALALDDKRRVIVATGATGRDDPRGRLYSIDPEKRLISMLYQSKSRRLTHLVALPRGALAAIGAGGGRVIHVAGGYARSGEFLTMPFDTGINSRFGVVQVYGGWPKGTSVNVSARTGQTAEPDDSWSDWSKPQLAPAGQKPGVPNGRYLQIRLTLESNGTASPEVHRVRMAYLRQNLPPFVREVVALRKGLALLPMQQETPKSKTISLSDKAGEDSPATNGAEKKSLARMRARQVERRGALTVKWVADDPNGDDLSFDLSYRPIGVGAWKTMEEELDDPFFTINSAQLPDGHYQFRVRVSDSPSNPDGYELEDSRDSRAILVDNTAPSIDPPEVTVNHRGATVRVVVADSVGPITSAEFALDGQDFRPLLPDDGVLDDAGEVFSIRLSGLASGQHTVTVRVADEAANEGYAEARFNVR